MSGKSSSSHRTLTLISLIIAGEAIFFLPFIIPRIFRPTLLIVFEINNTELGSYFSVYGVVAMVSYAFGGPLADRFSARHLMTTALFLTAAGGLFMATIPSGSAMKLLYGFYGMTTILLFWAALIRATREWGGENFQGKAFGWLEGGRGLTAALLGTFALMIFSTSTSDPMTQSFSEERVQAFQIVIATTSAITALSGFFVLFFVPASKTLSTTKDLTPYKLFSIAKIPGVWLLAVIIVCAYVGYKITDDFSLYANQVLGFNEVKATGVGTFGLWMRATVAFFVGFVGDKLKVNRIIKFGFVLSILGGLLVYTGWVESIPILAIINLFFLMIGIYGVRAMYFALIKEGGVPMTYTGTAVGLISIIGFTPDIFMSPWMGHLLDKYPGQIGHHYVFIVLTGFALIGLITTEVFSRLTTQNNV